jgi:endonuclease/exonuclease/phosphatase family metal-dependent hydrolase
MRLFISYFIPILLVFLLINCQEHVPATGPEPVVMEESDNEEALLKRMGKACSQGVFKVMTRNVYVGGDVDIVLGAEDPQMIPLLVAEVFATVQQTNFHERAKALAREIKLTRPHLIGLQEISTIFRQSPGDELNYLVPGALPPTPAGDEDIAYDFLEILIEALANIGMDYQAVAIGQNIDIEMPMATQVVDNQLAAYDDIRLIDYDVILARHDVQIIGDPLVVPYTYLLQVPPPPADPEIIVPRGFVSVVAKIGDEKIRFVNTHLESPLEAEPLRQAQAAELMGYLESETIPVVIVGDFNAPAPITSTYQSILAAGYEDAWAESYLSQYCDGFTFGHDANLLNKYPDFYERIDFIFHRSNQSFTNIRTGLVVVVGDEWYNRTASGLWPSDHGGVVARLHLNNVQVAADY